MQIPVLRLFSCFCFLRVHAHIKIDDQATACFVFWFFFRVFLFFFVLMGTNDDRNKKKKSSRALFRATMFFLRNKSRIRSLRPMTKSATKSEYHAYFFIRYCDACPGRSLLCLVEDNDLRAIWDIVMGKHTQIILQKDLVLNTHAHTRAHTHTQKHTQTHKSTRTQKTTTC